MAFPSTELNNIHFDPSFSHSQRTRFPLSSRSDNLTRLEDRVPLAVVLVPRILSV